MTRRHPSRVVIVAALAAALLLMSRSQMVSSLERAGLGQAPPARPQRIRIQTNRRPPKPLPVESYGMPVTYYSVRGDLQSTLTLNNKGPNPMNARVTLYARDGRRHGTDVSVPAHMFMDLDLRPIVAAAGEGFEDGSLRVSYSARIMEMGGLLRMTHLAAGIEYHEQLMYPSTTRSNELHGVWWLPDAATVARLVVTNTTGDPVDVKVRFESQPGTRVESLQLAPWALQVLDFGARRNDGRPADGLAGGVSIAYSGAPGGVSARGLIANYALEYSAVVPFSDPAEAKASMYHAGGVRVGDVGGSRLQPIIVARSTGRAARLTGRLRVTKDDGETTTIELPATLITPGRVEVIDAVGAWRWAREESRSGTAGIELEHDAPPGSMQIAVASVSDDFRHVFAAPLTDPATLPSATGGYFWALEDTRRPIVYLKNVTERPQRYHLVLRHAEGIWDPGLRKVPAGQSATIDIAARRQAQMPDAQGRIIPLSVSTGQVHWSIVGGKDYRGIVGRVEQVDVEHGVSSTYACPMPTADNFNDAWIEPDYTWEYPDSWVKFDAMEEDEDAYSHEVGYPYDISDILDWSSFNSGIASSDDGGWFLTGNVGSTSVEATGDSNGWEDYQGEGNPGNHVPITIYADLDVLPAYPMNFRKVQTAYFNGTPNAHPLPTLSDTYTWDSSSGSRSALSDCQIWEDLEYGTWDAPPFYGQPPNEQKFLANATADGLVDTHGTQGPLLMANGQPVAGVGPLTQRYKFRCTTIGNNALYDLSGPGIGPHSVTRQTTVNGSNWFFSITKHGISASCQLRTSSTAGWCQ